MHTADGWHPSLQLHGSYEALEAGQTSEALAALTGYPCECIHLRAAAATSRGQLPATPGVPDAANVSHTRHSQDGNEADPDVLWARLLSEKLA